MIVINCPAREDILNYEIDSNGNFFVTGIDTPDYCVKHKKLCNEVYDCITKRVMYKKERFKVKDEHK